MTLITDSFKYLKFVHKKITTGVTKYTCSKSTSISWVDGCVIILIVYHDKKMAYQKKLNGHRKEI